MNTQKEVLKNIVPLKKEKDTLKRVINSFLKKFSYKNVIVGGSIAKDTWLSGDCDIDLFAFFTSKHKDISRILERHIKKSFKSCEKLHGSRDYFQVSFEGFTFEIVPIVEITNAKDARNITDISPLHAVWVNKHTKKIKNEIRLVKQFCKANELYGAESHIGGFSGYVLEILIAHYGSFLELLKASQKWRAKTVIDAASLYPRNDALFHLNSSKTKSPLVVVDPVDESRNASAALTKEKFNLFKSLAKKYLKSESKEFFEETIISLKTLPKKKNVLYLELELVKGKRDVVGVKILKTFEFLTRKLEPFGIKDSKWQMRDTARMYFVLSKKRLPETYVQQGPPTDMKEHVKIFTKKHAKTYAKNGHVCADVSYKDRDILPFVKNALKSAYLREKFDSIITLQLV